MTEETKPPTREELLALWLDPGTRFRAQRYKRADGNKCSAADCLGSPGASMFWFNRYMLCEDCWKDIERHKPWGRDDTTKKPIGYLAPGYAFILPILMKKARPLGYAIAVHGSMNNDLDIIACPWVWDAVPADVLVYQLAQSCTPFYQTAEDGTYIRAEGGDSHLTFLDLDDFSNQPHGRRSWLIQLNAGCHIDVSVMPLLPNPFATTEIYSHAS